MEFTLDNIEVLLERYDKNLNDEVRYQKLKYLMMNSKNKQFKTKFKIVEKLYARAGINYNNFIKYILDSTIDIKEEYLKLTLKELEEIPEEIKQNVYQDEEEIENVDEFLQNDKTANTRISELIDSVSVQSLDDYIKQSEALEEEIINLIKEGKDEALFYKMLIKYVLARKAAFLHE